MLDFMVKWIIKAEFPKRVFASPAVRLSVIFVFISEQSTMLAVRGSLYKGGCRYAFTREQLTKAAFKKGDI